MSSRMLKANAAYALGSAANSAALLVLVPFLVNQFTTTEYGEWSLFEIGIVLLNMLLLAGADVGWMREHWRDQAEEQRQKLAGSVLLGATLWGLSLFVVAVAVSSVLQQLGILSANRARACVLAYLAAWAEALFTLLLSLFRMREQAERYVVLAGTRMLAFLILAVLAVRWGGGVAGALAARVLAALCGVAAAMLWTREAWRWAFDRAALTRVLGYGLPLLPANLASYVLLASDRYFLTRFGTLEIVACYAFAYKIAAVVEATVTRPFGLDWAPRRFRIAAETDAPARYGAALLLYVSAGCACVLVVFALTPAVYAWLAPRQYGAGRGVVPILIASYLVSGLAVPLNVGIMLKDRTRWLPQIQWAAAGLCLVLNLVLIPEFGMWGAAWATLLAYSVSTFGIAALSLRLYPIAYALSPIAQVLALGGAGVLGAIAIDAWVPLGMLLLLALKLAWVGVVCALLAWRLLRARGLLNDDGFRG